MGIERLFLIFLASMASGLAAHANERVALVVGNSSYRASPLTNPRNDANAMADLLSKAGFVVDKQLDTDLGQLQSAVDRFGQAIRDPKVKFGLFYYAGHGLQQDWRNYMVPVTANIRTAADVPRQAVDVSNLLRYMEQTTDRSFLIVLDACRDDPFAGNFRPAAKGLSQFDAPVGSLLAYATSPGAVAQDGEGRNGLYTGYLLKEFAVPGARLEDAFKRVRLSVRLASRGAQVPWESTSLEEDLYLFPLVSHKLSEADRDKLLEKEMTTWLRVKSTTDPEVLAGFIREYPSGSASELAQSRMNRLLSAVAAQDTQRQQQAAQAAAQVAAQAQAQAAARESAARLVAQQAEEKRLAAERSEQERVRLAQLEKARGEEQRQQAAAKAAALAETARIAAETARMAELETQRVAAAQMELAKVTAAKAEAQRVQEAARQSQLLADVAAAELLRLQALRLQKEADERALALKAEEARVAAVRLAQAQQAEATRLESERLALVAAAPAPAPVALAPTPFYKGYNEHRRQYSIGDEMNIRVIDGFNKSEKPLRMVVTHVDVEADRVLFNDGAFASDTMGNVTTNDRGAFSTPRQFYPADLFVGKKWSTRFKQTRPNGVTYTFQYDLKVVGKEKVTVPAGTFEAYRIEARGFNIELGARLERNIWVAPGINADIVHEIKVRLRNGNWDQNDRQELASYVQAHHD